MSEVPFPIKYVAMPQETIDACQEYMRFRKEMQDAILRCFSIPRHLLYPPNPTRMEQIVDLWRNRFGGNFWFEEHYYGGAGETGRRQRHPVNSTNPGLVAAELENTDWQRRLRCRPNW